MRNPNYRGEFKPKVMIEEYKMDYVLSDITVNALGLEIFVSNEGLLFNNFLVADNEEDLQIPKVNYNYRIWSRDFW